MNGRRTQESGSNPAGFFDAFTAAALKDGYSGVAGIDEVGRGPLAGPVIACAVIITHPERVPVELTDSKKLSALRRESLAEQMVSGEMLHAAYGVVSAAEIDATNILRATHSAMRQAVLGLGDACDFALVDGRPVPSLPVPSQALVKGDSRCLPIAAASVLAKVKRDGIMSVLGTIYPGYGFAEHKGYATEVHRQRLSAYGPCAVHRRSFGPVARAGGWQHSYSQPRLL